MCNGFLQKWVDVSIILMAAVMVGAFGPLGHGPCMDSPFSSSPLAWTLMIIAMVLGGLGLVAFILVPVPVPVRALGPPPSTSLGHSAPAGPTGIAARLASPGGPRIPVPAAVRVWWYS